MKSGVTRDGDVAFLTDDVANAESSASGTSVLPCSPGTSVLPLQPRDISPTIIRNTGTSVLPCSPGGISPTIIRNTGTSVLPCSPGGISPTMQPRGHQSYHYSQYRDISPTFAAPAPGTSYISIYVPSVYESDSNAWPR